MLPARIFSTGRGPSSVATGVPAKKHAPFWQTLLGTSPSPANRQTPDRAERAPGDLQTIPEIESVVGYVHGAVYRRSCVLRRLADANCCARNCAACPPFDKTARQAAGRHTR